MSVKYPTYVNVTSSIEEQPNERTHSPPPRKKSLSPPQASLKSITRKSTHYTSSSSPIMLDSKDSTVTYTDVSSPFADFPNIGSPGVDGPPVMPEDPYAYVVAAFQAPPSPDYVSGPEYPPSPEFVLEPVYPEFMPLEDEILLVEEQPLPAAISPTSNSPGYDEEVDIDGDEEEEEHPAPADSTAVALPAVDQAPSAEETEPFETDESTATPPPHPAYHITARISIRDETPISLPPREEVERLLAIPTPPSSPLSPWSSPLPQIPYYQYHHQYL
ncbi:hypothetical protein Tco_0027252 [Tanacetum coccineum]